MLGAATPFTALVFALGGLAAGTVSNIGEAVGGAFVLIYFWGALTGSIASLLHSALVGGGGRLQILRSATAGFFLGAVAGALTPTMFTGLLEPFAILLGALAGLSYGTLVAVLVWPHNEHDSRAEAS